MVMGQSGSQTKMAADGSSLGREYQWWQQVHLGNFLYQSTDIIHTDLVVAFLSRV